MIQSVEKREIHRFTHFVLAYSIEGWAKIFMLHNLHLLSSSSSTFARPLFDSFLADGAALGVRFFEPLIPLLPQLPSARVCHDLSDSDWLLLGTLRVLHEVKSGRGFLQEVAATLPNCPDVSQFFSTLRSARRLAFCQEADASLALHLRSLLPDVLAHVPELAQFDVYAGDGHWHAAAVHDRRPFPDSPKPACGHFYALDLRRHQLRHLDMADQTEREHEHDMRALKRQDIATLRQGAKDGRKVLYVWDRAGIDLHAWEQWKRRGIYWLSRKKENMILSCERELAWEHEDPRNAGVHGDEACHAANGMRLRKEYEFITNQMTLPPGVLVELARRRWNIEKVFDELKNKLSETGAWASSAEAKKMQATFICITQQLLRILEHVMESEDQVRPEREIQRREKRIEEERQTVEKAGQKYPSLRAAAKRLTQHTVKLLRWLRAHLRKSAPWHELVAALRLSYASS
jgi:hypothetical protein